jgi:hypothetical protein
MLCIRFGWNWIVVLIISIAVFVVVVVRRTTGPSKELKDSCE